MNTLTSTLARSLFILGTFAAVSAHAQTTAKTPTTSSASPGTSANTAAQIATHAPVAIEAAWVRATVPQQQASGMFMTLTSDQDRKLVEVQSSAAQSTELHEMAHEGDVMRMRQVQALALPAGQAVELRPGSFHIMLIGLKAQIKENDLVPLALTFENAKGDRETQDLMVPARALNAANPPSPTTHSGHMAH